MAPQELKSLLDLLQQYAIKTYKETAEGVEVEFFAPVVAGAVDTKVAAKSPEEIEKELQKPGRSNPKLWGGPPPKFPGMDS